MTFFLYKPLHYTTPTIESFIAGDRPVFPGTEKGASSIPVREPDERPYTFTVERQLKMRGTNDKVDEVRRPLE
jgi:hypothetical protein